MAQTPVQTVDLGAVLQDAGGAVAIPSARCAEVGGAGIGGACGHPPAGPLSARRRAPIDHLPVQLARSTRASVEDGAMSPAELELLQRHAPLLRLDLLERFAPVAFAPFLARAEVLLSAQPLSGPPADLVASAGAGPAGLHLDPVPGVPGGGRAAALFAAFAPAPGHEQWRCYGEVEPLIGGGRALSYWFFWVDNPFGIRFTDVGRHVGDWETVLVELAADDTIAAVTVMQHGSAHRVERGSPLLTFDAGGRPVVYVAEGSHAAYLTAGAQPRKLKQDNTSADGRSGVPQVLALEGAAAGASAAGAAPAAGAPAAGEAAAPPLAAAAAAAPAAGEAAALPFAAAGADAPAPPGWASWPGRWGPDTGAVLPFPRWLVALALRLVPSGFGGDSPPGPLARGKPPVGDRPIRRHTPGSVAPNAWLSRFVLQPLGNASWPREVAIDAAVPVALESRRVRARARVGGLLLRRARYVDAVVVDADGAALGHARAHVRGGGAELSVELVAPGVPHALHLAGYNALDQRSNVDTRLLG